MKQFRIQREITQWVEVVVDAEDLAEAYELAEEEYSDGNWSSTTGDIGWSDNNVVVIYNITEDGAVRWEDEYEISGYELEEKVEKIKKLKAKAAELELPVQWVEKLEII